MLFFEISYIHQFNQSVQSLSSVWLFVTPLTAARQASLSITNSSSLLKLMSMESVMPSSHLILCFPLLLLPSIFPSIRVFSNESVILIRWPKYRSFSFSISPSNEYSRLISFWIDWFDLLSVQGTLESLLQHHSSRASILRHSAFFMVLLSHPYMTTSYIHSNKKRTRTQSPLVVETLPSKYENVLLTCLESYLMNNECPWKNMLQFILSTAKI